MLSSSSTNRLVVQTEFAERLACHVKKSPLRALRVCRSWPLRTRPWSSCGDQFSRKRKTNVELSSSSGLLPPHQLTFLCVCEEYLCGRQCSSFVYCVCVFFFHKHFQVLDLKIKLRLNKNKILIPLVVAREGSCCEGGCACRRLDLRIHERGARTIPFCIWLVCACHIRGSYRFDH